MAKIPLSINIISGCMEIYNNIPDLDAEARTMMMELKESDVLLKPNKDIKTSRTIKYSEYIGIISPSLPPSSMTKGNVPANLIAKALHSTGKKKHIIIIKNTIKY
jgi:hypothetical protein